MTSLDYITMGKKYQTRDGRVVRILATDFKAGATCVIGAITMTDTNEIVGLWNARGEEFGGFDHLDDLIPVPTKHEGWLALHIGNAPETLPVGPVYITKEGATAGRDRNHTIDNVGGFPTRRMIIAHVTWED